MPANLLNKHPSDLQQACMAFIKTLREPAQSHSVYGQTRINRATGAVEQCIVIHRHPNSSETFRRRDLPARFGEFPIVEFDWPQQDL